jgi:2-desacetyl-2-hydroxyethyl bacteriochlorophyllide A dehydrogenase
MNSLAIDYLGAGQFKAREYEAEAPGPDDVVVAVAFTGICGTDLKIAHGAMDRRITSPWPIGHEMSGTLTAVGSSVQGWQIGDKVTVMPLQWCGECAACLAGHNHVCQRLVFVGIDAPGSLQQSWKVNSDLLIEIPDELDLAHAALAEPTAVAVHDVRRAAITAADQVVVIGGGPIGTLIAVLARLLGAEVLVSEVSDFRRDLLDRLELRTIDPAAVDLAAAVSDWTDGKGVEVAFEVSGSAAGVRSLTGVLAVRGRGVVVAIHTEPQPVDLMSVFWKELDLHGARVYEREDFQAAVNLLAEGLIPADELITEIMPLTETEAAIKRLSTGSDVVKILIDSR